MAFFTPYGVWMFTIWEVDQTMQLSGFSDNPLSIWNWIIGESCASGKLFIQKAHILRMPFFIDSLE